MKLYHGSNVPVKIPEIRAVGLSFPTMTEEWLDFVVDCRRGVSTYRNPNG